MPLRPGRLCEHGARRAKLVEPSDPIRLTHSPFSERMQQWSPDARWIAFTAYRDDAR